MKYIAHTQNTSSQSIASPRPDIGLGKSMLECYKMAKQNLSSFTIMEDNLTFDGSTSYFEVSQNGYRFRILILPTI